MPDQKSNPDQDARGRFLPGNTAGPLGRGGGISRCVRDLVGNDGAALVRGYWRIWAGEIKGTNVRDRLAAGQWLSDRGFGKAPEISLALDGQTAAALIDLQDSDLVTFAREFLGKRAAKVIEAQPAAELPRAGDQAVSAPVNSDQTPAKLPNSGGDPE